MTDAVDDITTVDDFLAVSENHILEDVNECVAALQVGFHINNLRRDRIKTLPTYFRALLINRKKRSFFSTGREISNFGSF